MEGVEIDQIYFQNEKTFDLDHWTRELPDELTGEYLFDQKNRLERVLILVTKKVSELILSHQPTYVSELERIADLQKSITESIKVCTEGRKSLGFIKSSSRNGTTIVEHYEKRKSLAKLLESLTAINDLRRSVIEIRCLIESQEDFPRAIQMCKDIKILLNSYDKFNCVNDLSLGLNRLWYDMKQKLSLLITNHDFSRYRFDEFIQVLRDTDLIVRACDEFCENSSSDDLVLGINNQASNFFNAYHNSSIDELKMFLENDLWEVLPVRNDFNLVQLKEFSLLRTDPNLANDVQDGRENGEDLFEPEYQGMSSNHHGLPLDRISLSSDSDLDSELNKDFVDEDEATSSLRMTKNFGPVLTNSSLHVLRLTGRYIQMMNVLRPISYEILLKIYKLLDHYTTFVFKKFGGSQDDKKLEAVISSLRGSLIGVGDSKIEEASGLISGQAKSIEPRGSKKAVAIESLIFLVNQLWNLQEYLESLISAEERAQLKEQFSQNYSMVPDFLKARAETGPSKR